MLVAEDHPTNRLVIERLLSSLRIAPDVVESGEDVLKALDARSYDVVLMDLRMPGMSGIETTRAIHDRLAPAERPRIVALTAHATTGDRQACLAAGMDGYLSKPIRLASLSRELERVLGERWDVEEAPMAKTT